MNEAWQTWPGSSHSEFGIVRLTLTTEANQLIHVPMNLHPLH